MSIPTLRSDARGRLAWARLVVVLLVVLGTGLWLPVLAGEGVPQQAPVDAATLAITTTPPGAAVIINGRRMGTTPFEVALPAGSGIVVRLELAGHEPAEQRITLTAGEREALDVALTATP